MLNVFITIDTEAWPPRSDRRTPSLMRDIEQDIYGLTADGEFGVRYQIDALNAHGLKGIFFVEAMIGLRTGPDPLRELVDLIQRNGHEVQLHLHTEWLEWLDSSPLPGRTGLNLKDFSLDEQTLLIAKGLEILRGCGASNLRAFRAGNYGANLETLTALARNNIPFDTSHNSCYLDRGCGMAAAGALLQPQRINGVYEFPISFFEDWPGHRRHAQLCACSANEMQHALMQAWRQGWYSFVIVSHSFELLRHRKQPNRALCADAKVVERFEELCRFLSDHRDKFCACGFNSIDADAIPEVASARPLRSRIDRTAWRVGEQLMRRIQKVGL